MRSLDIESIFTNIPLHKAIDICFKELLENTDTVEGLQFSSQNLSNCYVWPQRSAILYLQVYFISELTV